mmetsp:Transcript_17614/g.20289  ORF Transcript_17614/g.20289 Transcript_17614/m.20289 type:complete len:110 (+) Transcript_17614:103-432(+)
MTNSKGRFLFKIKFPNGDEELKTLGEVKEVTDHIHDTFQSNNFHLNTAKEQWNNYILQATAEVSDNVHMYDLFSRHFFGEREENATSDEVTLPNNENKKKRRMSSFTKL